MCMIVFIIVRQSGIHAPKGATPIARFGVDEEESSPKKWVGEKVWDMAQQN